MINIILASASPRRKELLSLLPITFEIISKETDETMDTRLTPVENVMKIAAQKAETVAREYEESLVIGCDTIVVVDKQILGKPKDKEEAYRMLVGLAGRTHKVFTGISLQNKSTGLAESFYEETTVFMKNSSDKEIWEYIGTGDPMDKAGSYGIQTQGALFVEKIEGDYFNVVGLPVSKLYEKLKQIKAISF
ncbi:MAG: Maf family protein [Cellulosilyticaceae bacterium]